jgi:hypothetical protein
MDFVGNGNGAHFENKAGRREKETSSEEETTEEADSSDSLGGK